MGKIYPGKAEAPSLPRTRYMSCVRLTRRSRCNSSSRCCYRAREHVDPTWRVVQLFTLPPGGSWGCFNQRMADTAVIVIFGSTFFPCILESSETSESVKLRCENGLFCFGIFFPPYYDQVKPQGVLPPYDAIRNRFWFDIFSLYTRIKWSLNRCYNITMR